MRDTQCVYWAIVEMQRSSQEEYWITAAACRSHIIEGLPGAMSHFVKIFLRTSLQATTVSQQLGACWRLTVAPTRVFS